MFSGNTSLVVLVHGHTGPAVEAREYVSPQDRNTYIEGREGVEFMLRIRNGSHKRVLAIPSVDGMSSLNGELAGVQSPGFVLEPFQSIDVKGWTMDSEEAAHFYFAGRKAGSDDSYVGRIGGDVANKGVIGVMVVEEDLPVFRSRPLGDDRFGGTLRASSATLSASSSNAVEATSAHVDEERLGTGYGKPTSMRTQATTFRRGRVIETMTLYYENERDLKRRGIDLSRPTSSRPNAFPAEIGCAPPPGWTR